MEEIEMKMTEDDLKLLREIRSCREKAIGIAC